MGRLQRLKDNKSTREEYSLSIEVYYKYERKEERESGRNEKFISDTDDKEAERGSQLKTLHFPSFVDFTAPLNQHGLHTTNEYTAYIVRQNSQSSTTLMNTSKSCSQEREE